MTNPTINETLSYMREEKVKHTKPHQAHYDNVLMALENQPRWIPVSERLPDDSDVRVLVTAISDNPYTSDKTIIIETAKYDIEWGWYLCDCFCTNPTVLAWQPLPKPYESEDNENDSRTFIPSKTH